MTKLERHRIKEIEKDSLLEDRFYTLFRSSISDQVSLDDFRKLFSKCSKMDLYFMKKNNLDIGVAYFMYCKNPENRKDIYMRLGFGIIKEERMSSYFPKGLIMKTMIRAKLLNIWKNVYMVGITMNPIVYSATCKYWKYSYPSPEMENTEAITAVKRRIIERFHLNEVSTDVIGVPFTITEVEEIKQKPEILNSENVFIKYFNAKIKHNESNKGLLSIVPIDFKNLAIVFIRKTKMDVMRSLYLTLEQKILPALKEYSPAR